MLQFDNYTAEEDQAIEELKGRTLHELPPKLLEDETLYHRFLKARDFNVEKAELLLRKHLSDRKIYGIDEIIDHYIPPKHINMYTPSSFVGADKEGFLVRYYDVGQTDYKGLTEMFTFKQILEYHIDYLEKDCEYMRRMTKKLGKQVSKHVLILNMDKLDLFQVTSRKVIEYALKGFPLYQDNYPERIKAVYVINASPYYNIAFSIVKKVLATAVVNKINVYGKSGWQEILLENIDADVLPAFLGGNRTDHDGNPLCNTFIVHGRKIPVELYANKNDSSIINEDGVEKLTVSRRSSSEINIYVNEPNKYIEWEIEMKSKDIEFGLYYKDISNENSNQEELIPNHRISSLISPETGMYKCDKSGMYVIQFDNNFSWFHSKDIFYRIRLVKDEALH